MSKNTNVNKCADWLKTKFPLVASARNNNENDRLGSLITAIHDLNAKFGCLEQKFEAFTQDVGVAANESGNNLDEKKDRHTRGLQEENEKFKSTNDYLTQCLSKCDNTIDDLKNKVKAAEDEKLVF